MWNSRGSSGETYGEFTTRRKKNFTLFDLKPTINAHPTACFTTTRFAWNVIRGKARCCCSSRFIRLISSYIRVVTFCYSSIYLLRIDFTTLQLTRRLFDRIYSIWNFRVNPFITSAGYVRHLLLYFGAIKNHILKIIHFSHRDGLLLFPSIRQSNICKKSLS